MRWARWWVVAAAAVTLVAGLTYVVAQQVGRRAADDVPRAVVEQWVARLGQGDSTDGIAAAPTVDLTSQASPFTIVYDASHRILASSATVHGGPPNIPAGLLDVAVANQGNHVTWQPQPDVRQAIVAAPWHSGPRTGVVVSGIGLGPTEDRAYQTRNTVLAVWVAALALMSLGLLATRRRSPTH